MQSSKSAILLKIASVLWVGWGLVHMLAGGIVLSSGTTAGFQAIADAVPPEMLVNEYHPAVGAVLNQHAWNLLWGGLVTLIGAILIWQQSLTAIWVTAMVGGLLDVGYFMFLDLGGHVHFMPGTLMTIFSGTAILLSFAFFWQNRGSNNSHRLSERSG